MPKMFLLFSHQLTEDQKEDAKSSLGVGEFVALPKDLQEFWSNIPPDIEDLSPYLEPIKVWLKENFKSGDYALVQGDFGATCKIANFIKTLGGEAVYATTKRNVEEEVIDGKTIKRSVFKHIKFRSFQ